MFFIKRILLTLIIILNCISANSHVQHYESLNLIKFDIYRNGKLIGYHSFSFDKVGGTIEKLLTVTSKFDRLYCIVEEPLLLEPPTINFITKEIFYNGYR